MSALELKTDAMAQTIGAKVKALRTGLGWSLLEASINTGVDQTMISEVERGIRLPTLKLLVRIVSPMQVECRLELVPTGTATLQQLVREIGEWQAVTFPLATASSVTQHLYREAAELRDSPTDPEEMADVFFMLVAAARASNVDLAAAVSAKFQKNKARRWGAPDAQGVVEHIAEGDA